MIKIKKSLLNFFAVLVIGGLGGVLASQFFLPYLATISPFSSMGFIQRIGSRTTIINPTEKITITENTATEDSIDKIRACLVVVGVRQNKRIVTQTTGFIMTSDGLIVTSSDIVYSSPTANYFILKDKLSLSAELVKVSTEDNLALFKVEESNLPVVSLTNLSDLRLGQRVLLVGAEPGVEDRLNYFVNLGIIRSINQDAIKLNFDEYNTLANGSPLVDVGGKVIGLNIINQKGFVRTVPVEKIKKFVEL